LRTDDGSTEVCETNDAFLAKAISSENLGKDIFEAIADGILLARELKGIDAMFVEIDPAACIIRGMENRERWDGGNVVGGLGDMGGKGVTFVAQRP